ncbi:MAG TPA: glycosyltransferase family 39 protein [Ktedonobacterales bacterium]|nr:glycosyltransferase family 39 protein [Ktedonobacterales bacterium]
MIVIVAAVLYLLLINQFSGNYDEGVYWQSLRAMAQGHPLFTAIFSSQPPYFLTSLYPFYMLFGQDIAAARIGIAVFALLGVVAMFWLGSELGGTWAGLIAAVLLAFEPFYLRQARTLESDGPAVAVSILAVALAAAAMSRSGTARHRLAALSGAILVYGLLIKLFAIVALVPILLCLVTPFFRVFDAGEGRLRRPTAAALRRGARAALPDLAWLAAGALVAALLLLVPFVGAFRTMWDQVIAFHIAAQKGLPSKLTEDFATAMSGFNLLFLLALVALGLAAWRRAWKMALPLLWLLASLLMLARLTPFFNHYAVLITPGVALMIALAPGLLAPIISRPTGYWLRVAVALAITAAIAVTLITDLTTSQTTLSKGIPASAQTQMAAVNAFTIPGELVVTDDPYVVAQAGHSVPPELVDTSHVRISTSSLTTQDLERIIERDHVRVIVIANDRLPSLTGFMPWLLQRYALAGRVGAQFAIYIRAPSSPGVA